MAWYYGTFSCGHEGRVNIIGPHKNREWKKERAFEKMCEECYEKFLQDQRETANREAAEKAKEMELPLLTGSEKQVSWANTLRQKLIDLFEKIDENEFKMAKREYKEFKNLSLDDIKIVTDYILINRIEAKYFIDNRFNNTFEFIVRDIKKALKTDEEIIAEKEIKDIKLESTVKPEEVITNIAAEIIVKEDEISVRFEKNDRFREIVKGLNYKWDGIWKRKISELTGSAEDRAAELGNKLLNAGFPICILDENIRNKAIKGEYEQECDRWIMTTIKGKYNGWLRIKWWERNDNLYRVTRKLPGSKWDNGTMVNIAHYKEVEEFAELYGFKFTKATLKNIEEYKNSLSSIKTVEPAVTKEEKPKDGLVEILNSGSEIIDDLKD